VGLISGVPDFTGPTPVITFSKFEILATSDQVPSLNLGEVPAYLLFQESRPIDDFEEFVKDYIASNRTLEHYSSNYYYHIFCTAFHSDHLELHLHMVTPNIFLTIEEANTPIEGRPDTKRSRSCATYTQPRVIGGSVETAYSGVTGVDDPRILALSYSIALNYRNTPILGRICGSVYKIEVAISRNFYYYEGQAVIEGGEAACQLRYSRSCALVVNGPEPPRIPGPASADLSQQVDELSHQIEALNQQLAEQDAKFQEALESRDEATGDLLQQIMGALQKAPPRGVPRFTPPKPVRAKQPKELSVACSLQLDRAISTDDSLSGFPVPALDSPARPSDVPRQVPGAEVAPKRIAAARQGSVQPASSEKPRAGAAQVKTTTFSSRITSLGRESVQLPPSLDQRRREQPNAAAMFAQNGETSFLVDDYSYDTKVLLGVLGVPHAS
jgi:hypothetical protein